MTIAAGRLKYKIELFKMVATQTDSGGATFEPEKYLDTYAEVIEESSTATNADGSQKINQSLKVTIRYRSDVTIAKGDRMTWKELNFILDNFKVDPRRTTIEMILLTEIKTAKR